MSLKSNVVSFILFQFSFFFLQIYIFYPCYKMYYRDKQIMNFEDIKTLKNNMKTSYYKDLDKIEENHDKVVDQVNKNEDIDDNMKQRKTPYRKFDDKEEKIDKDNAMEEIEVDDKDLETKEENDQKGQSKSDENQRKPNKQKQSPDEKSPEDSDEYRKPSSKAQDKTVYYEANWESLEQRPVPAWFDNAKVGVFIHWGVFSVPSFVGVGTKGYAEWFWLYWMNPLNHHGPPVVSIQEYMKNTYSKNFQYTNFASKFKAEFFDPDHWANVLQESGAKYVVLTSKHHEGYTLWKSKHSPNWNSVDVGPRRDLVEDLRTSVKNKTSLRFGLYYSLYEWFNPMFNNDKANHFNTQEYVMHKMMPDLHTLVNKYHPEIVWADGDGKATSHYWNSTSFIAWLYNHSPVKDSVVTNDRWGTDATCKHGGYLTCTDRYTPKPGEKVRQKWENCMTIDRESWGYRRNARYADHYDMPGLIELMAKTISGGGNLLVNIGPTADGRIPPIQEERLRQLGLWLKVNGEAVYGTKSCSTQQDIYSNSTYFTCKEDYVYAIITKWPDGDRLKLKSLKNQGRISISLLGSKEQIASDTKEGVSVMLPQFTPSTLPCQWGWVLKFKGVVT